MSQAQRWSPGNPALIDLPRPLAFVLSGGSAAGAVQVGMLRALTQAGIMPDLVVATSVGAINGALVAGLREDAHSELGKIWLGLDRSDILGSLSVRSLAAMLRSRRSVFDQASLLDLINGNLPARTFSELATPFAAVATNAHTGQPEVLKSGRLDSALLATSAIPGFFPQVSIGEVRYFDGGVTANVPVRQALSLGARSVLVLDAGQVPSAAHSPTNLAGTIQYVLGLMTRNQQSALVPLRDQHKVITLPLVTPAGLGCFDFTRTPELIERGYESTRGFLEADDGAIGEWPPIAVPSHSRSLV